MDMALFFPNTHKLDLIGYVYVGYLSDPQIGYLLQVDVQLFNGNL